MKGREKLIEMIILQPKEQRDYLINFIKNDMNDDELNKALNYIEEGNNKEGRISDLSRNKGMFSIKLESGMTWMN